MTSWKQRGNLQLLQYMQWFYTASKLIRDYNLETYLQILGQFVDELDEKEQKNEKEYNIIRKIS